MQKRLTIVALALGIIGAFLGCVSVWRVEYCFSGGGVTLGFPKWLDTWYWQSFGYLSFLFIAAGFAVEIYVVCRYHNTEHPHPPAAPKDLPSVIPDVQQTLEPKAETKDENTKHDA